MRSLKLFALVCAVCMLFVSAIQAAPTDMNVVIIFDGSGSMSDSMKGGKKIEVAKQALISVLSTIPDNTKVGILCFSGNTNGWIYPLQTLDRAGIQSAIIQVRAGGSTPLGQFMKLGANTLLERRASNRYGIYRLLIVTDGESTDNAEYPLVGEGGILEKGITVSVIGVNMNKKHSLATKVPYRSATDPNGLKTAIAEVFAETPAMAVNEDFDILAGLDGEVAAEIIKTLAKVDNSNIGERDPVLSQQSYPSYTSHTSHTVQSNSGSGWFVVLLFVGVILLFWFGWYIVSINR